MTGYERDDHQQDLQRLSTEIMEMERLALDLHTRATKLRMIRDNMVRRAHSDPRAETPRRMDWENNKGARDLLQSVMDYLRDKGKGKRYPRALTDIELTEDARCFAESLPSAFEDAKRTAKRVRHDAKKTSRAKQAPSEGSGNQISLGQGRAQ